MTMSMFGALTGNKKNVESDVVGKYPEYDSLARTRIREVVAYLCYERKRLRRIAHQVNHQEPEPTMAAQPAWHGTAMPASELTLAAEGVDMSWLAEQQISDDTSAESAHATPDWMAGAPQGSAAVAVSTDELVAEWMQEGADTSHDGAEETAPVAAQPVPADDPMAGWMQEASDADLDQAESAAPAAVATPSDDAMAGWMQQDTTAEEVEEVVVATYGETIGDIPSSLATQADTPIHADDSNLAVTEEPTVSFEDLLAYVPTGANREALISGKASAHSNGSKH